MSTKNAYEKKHQARLDEWAAEIDRLKAKAERADAETRIKLNDEIKEACAMQKKLAGKLAELRSSADHAWTDLRRGIEEATEALGSSLKSAASRLS